MSNNNVHIGAVAENMACEFLEKKGLKLIERNFETRDMLGQKSGEIDLIMKYREYIVFVEVKARQGNEYGDVLEMVTRQKQSRIIRAAKRYLVDRDQLDTTYSRFDVVGISLDKNAPNLIWIPDAFQVQYR